MFYMLGYCMSNNKSVNCSRPLWSCGICFSIKTVYQVEREFLEWKIITLLRLCSCLCLFSQVIVIENVLFNSA